MRTKMCPFRFIRVFLVIAALLACAAGADAGGGTRHYVTQSGDGSRNGDDWANAYGEAEFPAAILSAGAGDEIWVKAGVYRPSTTNVTTASFVLSKDVAIYGGFDGTETSSADRDPAANLTVLTGDLTNNDTNKVNGVTVSADQIHGPNSKCVVRTGSGCGPTTVLDGFTITAGENTTGDGGGMYNDHSSPAVTNCAFSGNSAFSYGGGMCNLNAGSPAVTNCTFSGNTAEYGGGMCNDHSSPAVTNCTFSGNSAVSYGGGMFNYAGSPAVTNCTFSGNTASSYGGGMFNNTGAPAVTNCTFSGNTAEYGGGMYNVNAGSPAVTNCTFSGNSAVSYGGGMCNFWGCNVVVTNCIFRNVSGGEIYNQDSTPDVSYCVVSGDDVGTGTVSSDIVSADPLLGPLADNGGPTKTHALLPGSPAIDKGKTFAASVISTDQRGAPRPYPSGGSFDIGAYEYGTEILTVTIIGSGSVTRDPSGDVVGDTGKCWSYPNGTPVTLTAVDGARGFFATWSGDATSSADTVTVTMSCDRYVEASFDVAWIITVSAGPGGDITPASGAGSSGLSAPGDRASGTTIVKVRDGANKTFTVTPNAGYSIGSVRLVGTIEILGAGSTYTLTNVTEDYTLEATFTANPTPTLTPTPTPILSVTPTPVVTPSVTPTPIPTPDPDIPLPTVTLTITLYAGGTLVAGPFDITDPATLSALLVSPTLLAQLLATDPAAILSGTYNMDLVRFFSLVADLDDGVLDFTLLFEVKVDGVPSGYRAQLFMLKRTFDAQGNPTGYAVVPRFEGENVFRKKSTSRGWTETWCVTIHDGGASDGDAKRDGSVAPQIAAVVAVFPAESPTVTPTQGSTGGGGCSLPALPGAASGVLLAALLLAPLLLARRR